MPRAMRAKNAASAYQPVRDGDDRLIDPGPVLGVALSEPLLRIRSDHAAIPCGQFGDVALEPADRSRHKKQENAQERGHAYRFPHKIYPYDIRLNKVTDLLQFLPGKAPEISAA